MTNEGTTCGHPKNSGYCDDCTRFAYVVKIENERDQLTLEWLNQRGYDATFLDVAHFQGVDDKGRYVYALTEAEAWEVHEQYEDDPGAFLACSGSDTLNTALQGFIDGIV